MTSRQIAQKAPYPIDVEAGKTYYWCACGQSKKQPFCDGSHKATDIVPVAWTAEKAGKSFFCGCNQKPNPSAMAATQNFERTRRGTDFATLDARQQLRRIRIVYFPCELLRACTPPLPDLDRTPRAGATGPIFPALEGA